MNDWNFDTNLLSYLNPVDGVFSFQWIKITESYRWWQGNCSWQNPKQATKNCSRCCCALFNGHSKSIHTDWYFPLWLETNYSVTIFKNGSKSDLNNYRSISVIPAVPKFSKAILSTRNKNKNIVVTIDIPQFLALYILPPFFLLCAFVK